MAADNKLLIAAAVVGGFLLLARSQGEDLSDLVLGDTKVPWKVRPGRWTTVHLHANETTSLEAAHELADSYDLRLLELDPDRGERRIKFRVGSQWYDLDPNRVFDAAGVEATVESLSGGSVPEGALAAAERFGSDLLGRIRAPGGPIISLHNNTPGKLTVDSFRVGQNAAAISKSSYEDPDDFYLVTSQRLFDMLKRLPRNVVLERLPQSDGSLSYVAQREGIPYVNIEAQHGHLAEQKTMLGEAVGVLEGLYG